MQYYDPEDNKSLYGGLIAFVAYVVALVCLFLLVSFSVDMPNINEGIMINLGSSESGMGQVDMALNEPSPRKTTPRPAAPKVEQEVVTSDRADAPVVQQKPDPKPRKEEVVEEQPRKQEVVQEALFRGNTMGSNAQSEGQTDKAEGNQGRENGSPDGAYADGGGTGNSGVVASLAGRSPVGTLGRPAYNGKDQGRVVIRIVVDAAGNVIEATYQPTGSNTDNQSLVEAALKEARRAKFNKIDDPTRTRQTGTITYTFALKQ